MTPCWTIKKGRLCANGQLALVTRHTRARARAFARSVRHPTLPNTTEPFPLRCVEARETYDNHSSWGYYLESRHSHCSCVSKRELSLSVSLKIINLASRPDCPPKNIHLYVVAISRVNSTACKC